MEVSQEHGSDNSIITLTVPAPGTLSGSCRSGICQEHESDNSIPIITFSRSSPKLPGHFLEAPDASGEAWDLLRALARAKARERPQWLRASALQLLPAAQRALAATPAGLPSAGQDALDGAALPLFEVLAVARHGAAEAVSRLPLRPG